MGCRWTKTQFEPGDRGRERPRASGLRGSSWYDRKSETRQARYLVAFDDGRETAAILVLVTNRRGDRPMGGRIPAHDRASSGGSHFRQMSADVREKRASGAAGPASSSIGLPHAATSRCWDAPGRRRCGRTRHSSDFWQSNACVFSTIIVSIDDRDRRLRHGSRLRPAGDGDGKRRWRVPPAAQAASILERARGRARCRGHARK